MLAKEFNPLAYHKPRNKNYNYYNAKLIKTHSEHYCFHCDNLIPPGSTAYSYRKPVYESFKSKATSVTRYYCLDCASALFPNQPARRGLTRQNKI